MAHTCIAEEGNTCAPRGSGGIWGKGRVGDGGGEGGRVQAANSGVKADQSAGPAELRHSPPRPHLDVVRPFLAIKRKRHGEEVRGAGGAQLPISAASAIAIQGVK